MIEYIDNKEQYDTLNKIETLFDNDKRTISDLGIYDFNRFRNEILMMVSTFIFQDKVTNYDMLKTKFLISRIYASMAISPQFSHERNHKIYLKEWREQTIKHKENNKEIK